MGDGEPTALSGSIIGIQLVLYTYRPHKLSLKAQALARILYHGGREMELAWWGFRATGGRSEMMRNNFLHSLLIPFFRDKTS